MLFLISGAAATGKTTTVKILNDKLENFECHDFDETPVKDGTNRRMVNEEWVQKALKAQENGKDFLLSAHSPLGELLACPSAIKLDGIKCCVLDCHDFVRVERYLARVQSKEWPLVWIHYVGQFFIVCMHLIHNGNKELLLTKNFLSLDGRDGRIGRKVMIGGM